MPTLCPYWLLEGACGELERADQRTRIQGQDIRGIPVMLDNPSGLIDPQDERPYGDVGQKRSDLPHRTRYRVLCPWLADSFRSVH